MTIKVLGVGSSLRDGASSTTALSIALGFAKKQGAETRLLDLKQTRLPLYDPTENQSTLKIKKVKDDVNWADAFILSTPDYHGSMSGTMKNLIIFGQNLQEKPLDTFVRLMRRVSQQWIR